MKAFSVLVLVVLVVANNLAASEIKISSVPDCNHDRDRVEVLALNFERSITAEVIPVLEEELIKASFHLMQAKTGILNATAYSKDLRKRNEKFAANASLVLVRKQRLNEDAVLASQKAEKKSLLGKQIIDALRFYCAYAVEDAFAKARQKVASYLQQVAELEEDTKYLLNIKQSQPAHFSKALERYEADADANAQRFLSPVRLAEETLFDPSIALETAAEASL